MKRYLSLILIFILSISCSGNDNTTPDLQPDPDLHIQQPYIVAYLPTWKMPYNVLWSKITHLCLAFGLVQSDGSLNTTEVTKYKSVIDDAHLNNVKVLLSVGGGGTTNFSSAILNEKNRSRLVDNIVNAITALVIDGVDIDFEEWEGGTGGASSNDIVKRTALEETYRLLRNKLGSKKIITAAVSGSWDNGGWGYYNCYNNTMHEYLDFVSLMIYDETGPWSGSNVGSHSSWNFYVNSINHWLKNRKLPKEKLIAGVPFYGYEFKSSNDATAATSLSYADILLKYSDQEAHLKDNIGLIYYDGIPTIEKKTKYAKENLLGGIMFWEITQDTYNIDKSLLETIYKTLKKD